MKRRLPTIYAIFCTLLLVAGFLLAFYFAWQRGQTATLLCVVGMLAGVVLSPIVHELGHVVFAKSVGFRCVFVKFFCFKIHVKEGKKRFAFASPFAADETQVIPANGGDMPRRAARYTLGGLFFSGIFLGVLLAATATLAWLAPSSACLLLGTIPYAAYLFLLNFLPLEYASGKTDALVYRGIKRGEDAEKCMLSAMEVHGQLSEGKSFGEIDEHYYFGLPQLREDEPLFAVLADLRYRYYLDIEEFEKAADCLNRLAQTQAYLSEKEVEKVAVELVYMHALNGDRERAEESAKLCQAPLRENTPSAKRVLAAVSRYCGKEEAVAPLIEQAQALLSNEPILGVRKFEERLLSRLTKE